VGVGEADIDTDTGEVRLTRYVSAADVGRVMNRKSAEGQDEGAAVQALGHSLWEELVYEDGQPLNASMIDYHVPAIDETPRQFVTLLVESGDGPGPGGSRGMGEGAILPVAPVIANALARRYGARVRDLPLTPERVWRALQQARKKDGQ
jgi:CO/xanthine dehydrogenase Mo-binding subunit